jgi:hypothetical protein
VGGTYSPGIRSAAHAADGSLYVAGGFTEAGGQEAYTLARWDGMNWSGLGNQRTQVRSLAFASDGSLYAAGGFSETTGNVSIVSLAISRATGLPTESEPGLPTASVVSLSAAYPNPARGQVTLGFALAEAGPVRLALYDVLGREVAVPLSAPLGAGPHEVTVPTSGLGAGVYVVRLEAGGEVASSRITVVR